MIKELVLPGIPLPRSLAVTHMRPPELTPGPNQYEVLVEGEQSGIGGAFLPLDIQGKEKQLQSYHLPVMKS